MRRKRRKPARKSAPVWLWLVTGILLGLGLATAAIIGGYVPQPKETAEQPPTPTPGADRSDGGDAIVDESGETSERRRYDFFTVLPEMEVVVPEQEIRKDAETDVTSGSYVLQVGSFRNAADAERMKAQLALLGLVGQIQTVKVNDATWHRVRLGPYTSAREVDGLRRRLQENRIDSRVYKDQ